MQASMMLHIILIINIKHIFYVIFMNMTYSLETQPKVMKDKDMAKVDTLMAGIGVRQDNWGRNRDFNKLTEMEIFNKSAY